MKIEQRIERWENELVRLSGTGRWGESRRFAGRRSGNRADRRRWLVDRIASAKVMLNKPSSV